MKHIKLLGLLATAAALSFTVTSCSNGDAGDDAEFPPPGEATSIPQDIKGDDLIISNFPSLMQGVGSTKLQLLFSETVVGSYEDGGEGRTFHVNPYPPDGASFTYTPISETEAKINIASLTRPLSYDATKEENKYEVDEVPILITLKYSESTGTYSAEINGVEYTDVMYIDR